MIIEPLAPAHLQAMQLQPAQAALAPLAADRAYAEMLAGAGPAFAGRIGDMVVGCAGVVLLSAHRGHAWALIGAAAPAHFLAIHRAAAAFLAGLDLQRVETAVACDFAAGQRWVRMLGFAREGRMRAYDAGGGDADLFARVRMPWAEPSS
jgi:hypothetical protein